MILTRVYHFVKCTIFTFVICTIYYYQALATWMIRLFHILLVLIRTSRPCKYAITHYNICATNSFIKSYYYSYGRRKRITQFQNKKLISKNVPEKYFSNQCNQNIMSDRHFSHFLLSVSSSIHVVMFCVLFTNSDFFKEIRHAVTAAYKSQAYSTCSSTEKAIRHSMRNDVPALCFAKGSITWSTHLVPWVYILMKRYRLSNRTKCTTNRINNHYHKIELLVQWSNLPKMWSLKPGVRSC